MLRCVFCFSGTNIYMLTLGDFWSSNTIDLYLHRRYTSDTKLFVCVIFQTINLIKKRSFVSCFRRLFGTSNNSP